MPIAPPWPWRGRWWRICLRLIAGSEHSCFWKTAARRLRPLGKARRLPGPAGWPTERRRSNSRGSLRIVSGLAENTNSIFCEGPSGPETANGAQDTARSGRRRRAGFRRSLTYGGGYWPRRRIRILDPVRHHLFFALIAPPYSLRWIGIRTVVGTVVVMHSHNQLAAFLHVNRIGKAIHKLPDKIVLGNV